MSAEDPLVQLQRIGEQVRRDVLGDDHVDRARSTTTAHTSAFQEMLTRTLWGTVWSRPGLDSRARRITAIVSLVALHHWEELPAHLRAAVRSDLTPDEVVEILLQTTLYAGFPAGNHAFAIAREVFAETQSGPTDRVRSTGSDANERDDAQR